VRMRIQRLADGTEEIDIKLLDDGRVHIHLLIECDDGPITIQGHAQLRNVMGRPTLGRYRVVCRPQQTTTNPQKRGNVRFMCITTGEVAAATCPACLAIGV